MHMISVHFGPNQLVWALMYKDEKSAAAAEVLIDDFMSQQHLTQQIAAGRMLSINDDYGQKARFVAGSIHGYLLEDLDLTQEATIKKAIHHEITKVKAQTRARNDATLKAAGLGQGLPSFDPMAGRQFSS